MATFISKISSYYILGIVNSRFLVEKPLHPTLVSFRAAYGQRGGVIATNFIVNETGATVTINGLRYREKIHDFLLPDLDDIDLTALRAAHQSVKGKTSLNIKTTPPIRKPHTHSKCFEIRALFVFFKVT